MGKREVEILLEVRDETKKGFDSVERGIKDVDSSLSSLSRQWIVQAAAAVDGVTSIGGALQRMGRAAISAYNLAITSAAAYEASLANVNAIMNEGEDQTYALGASVSDLAVQYGQIITEMGRAAELIGQSGFSTQAETLGILESASRGAVAGMGDVNSIAEKLTKTLAATGKGAEYADAALAHIYTSAQTGTDYLKALGEDFQFLSDGTGELDRRLEESSQTLEHHNKQLEAAATRLQAAFGGLFLEGHTAVVEGFTEAINKTAEALETETTATQSLTASIGRMVGAVVGSASDLDNYFVRFVEGALHIDKAAAAMRGFEALVNSLATTGRQDAGTIDPTGNPLQNFPRESGVSLFQQGGRAQAEAEAQQSAEDLAAAYRATLEQRATEMGIALTTLVLDAAGNPELVDKETKALVKEIERALSRAIQAADLPTFGLPKDTSAAENSIRENDDLISEADLERIERLYANQELVRLAQETVNAEFSALGEIIEGLTFQMSDTAEKAEETVVQVVRVSASARVAARAFTDIVVETPFALLQGQAESLAETLQTTLLSALKAILRQLILIKAVEYFSSLPLFGGAKAIESVAKTAGASSGAAAAVGGVPQPATSGLGGPDLGYQLGKLLNAQESGAYASPYGDWNSGDGGGGTVLLNVGLPESQAGLQRMTRAVRAAVSKTGEL